MNEPGVAFLAVTATGPRLITPITVYVPLDQPDETYGSFEFLPYGPVTLTAEAMDASCEVKLRGSADGEVKWGATPSISLSLAPVPSGTPALASCPPPVAFRLLNRR